MWYDFLHSYTTQEMTNILDVGCGTGHYAEAFTIAGFQTTGIDLDAAMIEYAIDHYPETTFRTMNMLEIESLDQKFDFVFYKLLMSLF